MGRVRGRAVAPVTVLATAAALVVVPVASGPAQAVFADTVPASATASARTITPPANLHCESILLLAGDLVWTASPDATSYLVTSPGGSTTVVAAPTTRYHLGLLSVGTWSVRAKHSSGWISAAGSVSVTSLLGIVLCS